MTKRFQISGIIIVKGRFQNYFVLCLLFLFYFFICIFFHYKIKTIMVITPGVLKFPNLSVWSVTSDVCKTISRRYKGALLLHIISQMALPLMYLRQCHYSDVMMGAILSQITSPTIVYSTVYSGADQRKHQSSESLAFVRGIHRSPVNSPRKWPVTRKMLPFDDVIICKKFLKRSINIGAIP